MMEHRAPKSQIPLAELRNGDRIFAERIIGVVVSSVSRHLDKDEVLLLFGGSQSARASGASKIASDLDIAGFIPEPSSTATRLNPKYLKKFYDAIRGAVTELKDQHGIYAAAAYDPNLGPSFKYLAKYHVEASQGIQIDSDKIVLLDCLFYPSLNSAISWPNPILGGLEVFEGNVTRMLRDKREVLVYGTPSKRPELSAAIDLAKSIRDTKSGAPTLNSVLPVSEKQIAMVYGNLTSNINLPAEMLAIETLNQMKNISINLIKFLYGGRDNWYWGKVIDSQDILPDYMRRFILQIEDMRNGEIPSHQNLVKLLDHSINMVNDLTTHMG